MNDKTDFIAAKVLRYAGIVYAILSLLSAFYFFTQKIEGLEKEFSIAYGVILIITGAIVFGICISIASISENTMVMRNKMFEDRE